MMKSNILNFACLLMLLQPLLGAIIQDSQNQDARGAISNSLQQEESCQNRDCEHGGVCFPGMDGYKCQCLSPYTGTFCENELCKPNPCLNGGKCEIEMLSDVKCICLEGFEGDKCETKPNCENGQFTKDSSGNTICECNPTYGLISKNKCKACDCGQSANCVFEKSLFGDKTCLCPDGFMDIGGKCGPKPIDFGCKKACKNGLCVKIFNIEACSCTEGYEGDLCDQEKGKKAKIGLIVGLCVGIPVVLIAGFFIFRYVRNRRSV